MTPPEPLNPVTSGGPLDVSVCIPVYNEKEALRSSVLELKTAMDALPYSYEIIVVDDGSDDGCIEQILDLDVRILRHRKRFGGGVARVTAMRYARGRIILQSDADGTYPCTEVPTILKAMDHAELVIGARRSESAQDWRLARVFMKWVMKSIASVLVGRNIPDLNSGMRAYDRKLAMRYHHLYPKGHSIMSTMTLSFMTEGHRVEFVPIDYRRRLGKSSFHPVRDTYNYLVTTVRTVVNFDPLRVLLPVVGILAALALVTTIRNLIVVQSLGSLPLALWLSSAFVLVLAILSDQIARLTRQVAGLTNRDIVGEDDVEEVATAAQRPGT